MIDNNDILNFLEGKLNEEKSSEVKKWADTSAKNSKELEFYRKVLSHSSSMKDDIKVDVDKAWKNFEKETNIRTFNPKFRKIIYYSSAIAASIVIVFFVARMLFTPQPLYQEIVTNDFQDTIKLVDGSIIYLGDSSKAIYYTRLTDKQTERYVEVHGSADFDIAPNKDIPFVVKINDAGIRVLGTKFSIKVDGSKIECANEEGVVKLYEWENPNNGLILNKGEKAVFDGGKIERILPPKPKPPIGKFLSIEYIIEYFFEHYVTLVNTAPYSDINMNDKVFVNLKQPLPEIISQLDSTSIIQYRQNCNGCYEFTVFKSK